MSGRHRKPTNHRLLKTTLIGGGFAGLALATAAPAAADEPIPPNEQDRSFSIGRFSAGVSGIGTPRNYSYSFALGDRYILSSTGNADGISSSQTSTNLFRTRNISQSYGTDYEGASCILCQEVTTVRRSGTWASEYNVLRGPIGIELEVDTPLGNFSLPRE